MVQCNEFYAIQAFGSLSSIKPAPAGGGVSPGGSLPGVLDLDITPATIVASASIGSLDAGVWGEEAEVCI